MSAQTKDSQQQQQPPRQQQHGLLSVSDTALAGAVSGFVSRVVIAPFDVLKIRFQLQLEPISKSALLSPPSTATHAATPLPKYQSMAQAARLIAKEEGLFALWKGNLAAELLYIVYGAVQFSVFHSFKAHFLDIQNEERRTADAASRATQPHSPAHHGQRASAELTPLYSVAGGAVASSIASIASYPLDVLRTRFASQGEPKVYKSIVGAFYSIATREGISSLYRGLTPTLIQILPYMGLQFGFYESMKTALRTMSSKENPSAVELSKLQIMLIGSLAGVASKICVLPLDTVKKRLQVQGFQHLRSGFGRQQVYLNVADCFRKIVAEEGLRGLYKGSVPSVMKAGPATAITFTVYESLCTVLSERRRT